MFFFCSKNWDMGPTLCNMARVDGLFIIIIIIIIIFHIKLFFLLESHVFFNINFDFQWA